MEYPTATKAKALLVATDYTQLGDVAITNEAEFTAYRAQLRAIIIQVANTGQDLDESNLPTVAPKPIWSFPESEI